MTKKADFKKIFNQFLIDQNLVDQKILLMISGGVDSMVLLDVAVQVVKPKNLVVFHLNHNARVDSAADLKFVQKICSEKNITFYHETLPLSKRRTKGDFKNQESSWRNMRKMLSQEVADKFGATKILTAHHATDLVETMIFRLTKGTGTDGLSPFDTSTKPFWQVPKTEIVNYAEQNNLEWREDPTNLECHHQRNLIRHQVLPALREITPNLEKVFVRESQLFAQTNDFINQSVLDSCHPELDSGSMPLSSFLALSPILQCTWLRQVSGGTPSLSEIEDCLKWLTGKPEGNTEKKIGNQVLKFRNGLIILQ